MNKKKRMRLILTIAAAAAVLAAAVIASAVMEPADFDDITTIGTSSECPQCGSGTIVLQDYSASATCFSPQYAAYKCSSCNKVWKAVVVDQLRHMMTTPVVERAATCTAKGLRKSECRRGCGYEETEYIPIDSSAHKLEARSGTEATCETPGTQDHWECTLCHSLFGDAAGTKKVSAQDIGIPASGHAWDFTVTEPTCTAGGFTTKTCSVCGTSGGRTDLTDPAPHIMEKGEGTRETCTQTGVRDLYRCTVCHGVFLDADGQERADEDNSKIPAPGHNLVRTAGAAPSCEEGGVREHWTCTRCGQIFADAEGEGELESTELPPAGHVPEHVFGKDATCETEGSSEHWQCTECGKFFSDEACDEEISFEETLVPAAGHKLEHFTEKPAGEDEDGWLEYWKCTVCGKLFGDAHGNEEVRPEDVYIVAMGHTIEAVPEKPAECTKDGVAAHYVCTGCGALFEDAKGERPTSEQELRLAAPGHREESVVTDPTCTASGHTTHTCTVCGNVRTDLVRNALGHDLVHLPEKPATETEAGEKEHWRCTRCGLLFQDKDGKEPAGDLEIPAAGHTWEDTVVPPSCTEPGYTEHRCTDCGETTKDSEVPAKGHVMEHVPARVATEDEDGVKEHWMCTQCGKLFETENGSTEIGAPAIPATGHSYVEQIVPPTCTEPGYTEHVCDGCGDTFQDNETSPAGHALEHVPGTPATEDEEGRKEHWACTVCGAIFEDEAGENEIEDVSSLVIPALGHAYEDTTVPADCVTGGYTEHVCKDCGRTYTDMETAPLGHIMTRFPAQAPTLTREGNIEYWKCERCGLYFEDAEGTKEIPPESVVRARLEKDPGGGSVATGDTKDPLLYLIVAGAGSAFVLIFLFAARRRARRTR